MSNDALNLLMDVVFVGSSVLLAVWALVRRRSPGTPEPPPGPSLLEFSLAGALLIAAAAGPNILVVATTPGMPGMDILGKWVLLPSIILVAAGWIAAVRLGMTRLVNRIVVGVWAGWVATGFLDAIRLTGFHLGFMPGDMPRMFGVMFLDQMALGPSPQSDLLGHLYHFWVGACFGLTYTLLVGRFRWWGGLLWGLLIELGMMVTPPMVVAMDTGYFGSKFGPGLFVTSLLAHIALGVMLGLLCERYLRHPGSLLSVLHLRKSDGDSHGSC